MDRFIERTRPQQRKEQVTMSNEFTMTTGQSHELAQAFGRNGWNNGQVKKLSEGDFLKQVLDVLLGKAEIRPLGNPVDMPKTLSRLAFVKATLELWDEKVGFILETKKLTPADRLVAEKDKVTTDELGSRLGCSGANIRQIYNRYREEMRIMVKENPSSFGNLRHLQAWNTWFVR
ncbi:MAG: hypothetical protein KGI69_04110 [Patescibacteria group bacterium]|nr:hypothetical protein [Patescibacteria group bacterium]